MPPLRAVSRIAGAAALVSWPFCVWLALTHPEWRALMLALALLFALRLAVMPAGALRLPGIILLLAGTLLALAGYWLPQARLMLWYPVLVNLVMLLLFGGSLFAGPPLVERIARWQEGGELPLAARRYTRKVTRVWSLFFLINGGLALAAVLSGSLRVWTLWNGVLSYLAMGTLFAVEWCVRQRVKRHAR
jgi:uncharacterized membrane protein